MWSLVTLVTNTSDWPMLITNSLVSNISNHWISLSSKPLKKQCPLIPQITSTTDYQPAWSLVSPVTCVSDH